MQTLELKINVDEKLITRAGIDSLKSYLEKAAENFKFNLIAEQLRDVVGTETQMDSDFKTAKQSAWAEYKEKYLPDHLKEVVNRKEKR